MVSIMNLIEGHSAQGKPQIQPSGTVTGIFLMMEQNESQDLCRRNSEWRYDGVIFNHPPKNLFANSVSLGPGPPRTAFASYQSSSSRISEGMSARNVLFPLVAVLVMVLRNAGWGPLRFRLDPNQ